MLPLSEELAQARRELSMWLRLHEGEDGDLNAWRAIVTIDKAISALRHYESALTQGGAE